MKLCFWRKPKYRIETFTGAAGSPCWRIVSAVNGQILAHSESYSDAAKRDQTATAVARDAGWEIRKES
jgi:hypothetical protein